jgi:hypothetical protein
MTKLGLLTPADRIDTTNDWFEVVRIFLPFSSVPKVSIQASIVWMPLAIRT